MNQLIAWVTRYNLRIDEMFGSALIFAASLIVIFYADKIVRRLLSNIHKRFRLSYETVLFIARVIDVFMWIGAGLLLLEFWGISVAGLWAVLMSAVAVIGVGFLAVWTIISNITANFFLTVWRPFNFGATVELLPENLRGRVIERNMMFTILREKEGTRLYIPNNFFFQKIFRVTEDNQQHLFEFFENRTTPPPINEINPLPGALLD